jgi:rod shape determining protein RodA
MIERARTFISESDWLLSGAMLILIATGLIAVWSVSLPTLTIFWRQLMWVILGLMVFFIMSSTDYRFFKTSGIFLVLMYGAILIALGSLLVFAPETRGVQGWFRIGSTTIQPVEVMKLVLVLVLAKYFALRHVEISRLRHLFISGAYAGAAIFLVLLQPDLGSAIILSAIWIAMVMASGIRWRHLLTFGLVGVAIASVGWFTFLHDYQKERIISFVDPYADPRGAGYNTIQAMIATGSGQWWGKGIGFGTQSHLNFLPEAETDFIFAAFAEETGFIGGAILIGVFGVLFWRIVKIGLAARDNFAKLFVLGFGSFLFVEAFIHIAINVGVLPVTGIVLPFVSYGGSSMITTLMGLGIVQSIRMNSSEGVAIYGIGE